MKRSIKNLHLLIVLIAGITFFSCRKIIEPKDIPQQEPQLVLNAVLTSSYTMGANISLSRSIVSGKDYKYVNNAVCEVYEDGVYLQNFTFINDGNYAGSVAPKPGKKYMLKIAAAGYEAIQAETFVPSDVQITPIEQYDIANSMYSRRQYGIGGEDYVNGVTKFRFKIIDDRSVDNYYSISSTVVLLDSLDKPINYTVSPNISNNKNSSIEGSQNVYGSAMDLDDRDIINGNEIQIDIGVNLYVGESRDKLPIKTIKVSLSIHNISKDYYRYRQTVVNQMYSSGSLFAEPVQVYSNVSNGMGILAGDNVVNIPVYSGEVVN